MSHPLTEVVTADVVSIDHQRHSLWLRNGRRLGFAAAPRLGLDPEGIVLPVAAGQAVTA